MSTEIAKQIAAICTRALRRGGKIMFAGNGGSAADAQHLAAELVGKLNFDRPGLAAISLTDNPSIITAIGNDYGFEHIFSRQIEALGNCDDVLIAMSTSGNSKNIINAIFKAGSYNIFVIGMTGLTGGIMAKDDSCDILFQSSSDNTQEIQEEHMRLGHSICGLIEKDMFAC